MQTHVKTQQNIYNIYPYSTGGPQGLMGDGSVRRFRLGMTVPVWSAFVTPDGGEALTQD